MPYQPHTRWTFGGVFGTEANPAEIWSCSFATDLNVGLTVGQFTAGWTAINGLFASAAAKQGSHVFLQWVKAGLADATNHIPGTVLLHEFAEGNHGGFSNLYPPQIAIRVSLQGPSRARSNKGGFYLNAGGFVFDNTTYQLAAEDTQPLATAVRAMCTAMSAGGAGNVIIASGRDGNVALSRVRVGSVLDTIRRRRNALPESYVVA